MAIAWLWYIGKYGNNYGVFFSALATIAIAIFTWTLWRATDDALSHSRQVERAYVSVDASLAFRGKSEPIRVGHLTVMPSLPTGPWISITVDNNGKTPAFVDKVAIITCDPNELPDRPEYAKNERLVDISLSPGAVGINTLGFEMEEIKGKIVYGRVYYTDIYSRPHSSGFIRQVLSDKVETIKAPPGYTAWD